jgi:hypothetical protein
MGQLPAIVADAIIRLLQLSPLERGGNFPSCKALKIHKTAKESRFASTRVTAPWPSHVATRIPTLAAARVGLSS